MMGKFTSLATAVALLASACSGGSSDSSPGATEEPGDGGPLPRSRSAGGALQPFDHCDAVLDYVRGAALERVGPYGLGGSDVFGGGTGPLPLTDSRALAEEEPPTDDVAAAPEQGDGGAEPVEGVDFSGTNVQEKGVDEPDTVKTDGERLVAVVDGSLHYVDLSGAEPVLVSSLPLPGGFDHELLLEGDRAFVLAGDGGYAVEPLLQEEAGEAIVPPAPYGEDVTVLSEVDLANPERMTIDRTQYIQGRYLTARVVDGVARVVITSQPAGFDFVQPTGPRAEEVAEEANRRLVEESEVEQWIPTVLTEDGQGQITEQPLVACEQISHPEQFSGFGTLTVVSVDLGESLDTTDAVSVMADGETVYASPESLYVATNEWLDPIVLEELEAQVGEEDLDPDEADEIQQQIDDEYQTSIHQFDLSGDGPATYLASGGVDGRLLNQFAMSEHEGVLRVATTAGSPWGPSQDTSESFITTLQADDGVLTPLGGVGDMGKGEEIFSVRFIGDTAYVVTFRQTDPLYVVDLSDPAEPSVTGELKIPGYSSYLHPVGDDRLLGVGQDADSEGRIQGSQVSLFDVSNPADPQRLSQLTFGSGSSEAEWDHRAFLWWEADRLAVLPMSLYDYDIGTEFSGAVGLDVGSTEVTERGRVDHGDGEECFYEEIIVDEQGEETVEVVPEPCYDYGAQITRAVVVDDELLTVSSNGLGVNALDSLAPQDFLSW